MTRAQPNFLLFSRSNMCRNQMKCTSKCTCIPSCVRFMFICCSFFFFWFLSPFYCIIICLWDWESKVQAFHAYTHTTPCFIVYVAFCVFFIFSFISSVFFIHKIVLFFFWLFFILLLVVICAVYIISLHFVSWCWYSLAHVYV